MSKKTCHLLPILREGGWEWAFQGRHGIYLDPTHPTHHPTPLALFCPIMPFCSLGPLWKGPKGPIGPFGHTGTQTAQKGPKGP